MPRSARNARRGTGWTVTTLSRSKRPKSIIEAEPDNAVADGCRLRDGPTAEYCGCRRRTRHLIGRDVKKLELGRKTVGEADLNALRYRPTHLGASDGERDRSKSKRGGCGCVLGAGPRDTGARVNQNIIEGYPKPSARRTQCSDRYRLVDRTQKATGGVANLLLP